MKGTHTVVVERAKVKYTLTFKRNISFIRGNSGTGKTTLRLISDLSRTH